MPTGIVDNLNFLTTQTSLEFSLTGIYLSSIITLLANEKISVFAIST